MDIKRIVSVNMTVGTLCAAVAVAYPLASGYMASSEAKAGVEPLVQQVLRQERQMMAEKGRYILFGPSASDRARGLAELSLSDPSGRFTIEAFSLNDAALVVRAFTRPEVIMAGDAPAVLYEHRIAVAGDDGQGRWVVQP